MVFYNPVGAPVPVDGSYVATSTMRPAPTSRGILQIVSSSPEDPPAIDPNCHDTEVHHIALIHGVRRILGALLTTASGKEYIEREEVPEGTPKLTADPQTPTSTRGSEWPVFHIHMQRVLQLWAK